MERRPVAPAVFGTVCATLGFLTTLVIVGLTAPEGLLATLVVVSVGSFLGGWSVWRWCHDWIRENGRLAGAIIGFCACLLTQYLSWYLWFAVYWLGSAIGIAVDPGINPLEALAIAVPMTAMSVYITGIFTVPAGIIAGL